MKSRYAILTVLGMFSILIAAPVRLHGLPQTESAQHAQHHPGAAETPERTAVPETQANMMTSMMASDAKLDALVQQMNAAKGTEKTEAIAALLTALVQEQRTMRASMMMKMMMGGMGGHPDTAPKQ